MRGMKRKLSEIDVSVSGCNPSGHVLCRDHEFKSYDGLLNASMQPGFHVRRSGRDARQTNIMKSKGRAQVRDAATR